MISLPNFRPYAALGGILALISLSLAFYLFWFSDDGDSGLKPTKLVFVDRENPVF
jgi:hypothetical protein